MSNKSEAEDAADKVFELIENATIKDIKTDNELYKKIVEIIQDCADQRMDGHNCGENVIYL